jgi:hypothetical protein
VAGPPECLGFTPYCGLWFFIEGEPFGSSYQSVLQKLRETSEFLVDTPSSSVSTRLVALPDIWLLVLRFSSFC